jgi:signal transduction histidine kinase
MAVAGRASYSDCEVRGHFVRFYQAEPLLIDEVASFVERALCSGGNAIVIATQRHLTGIRSKLGGFGGSTVGARWPPDRFVALDAEEALSRFMVDGHPDSNLFLASIGAVVASMQAPGGGPVHAFGEMVGVLCERGEYEAALQLEGLWNELARRYAFTLFCAYSQALFSNAAHSRMFEHICSAHTSVLPSEVLAGADDTQANRLVALWQQKAMALELEVERRNRAERQRDALFMNAPVAAALLSGPGHVFELANRRFRELAGHAELAGRRCADVFPPAQSGGDIGTLLNAAFERGEPIVREDQRIDVTRPDGAFEPRYFTFHFEPLRLDSAIVEGIIVVAVDVTKQVRARARFEKSHAERERLVAELREAGRAKDEFLAMLGHELRNPLSPIVTALRLMRMRTESSTAREQSIIARQVDHLVRLVDDLLDMSRITCGKIALKRQTVRVADVLASAVEMGGLLLEQREHRLTVEVEPDLVWNVDATRLAQVVSNLLTNAARYTAPGGQVELVAKRERRGMIAVSVRDDGIGLAPDVLPRVFDLFFQGKRDLDRAEGGLGIGLALVKNLVEMHGGHVSATSEGPGCGSTFVILVPGERAEQNEQNEQNERNERNERIPSARSAIRLDGAGGGNGDVQVWRDVGDGGADRHEAPDRDAVPARRRAGSTSAGVAPRRVLLVDDNVDGVQALAELLRECGHDVEAVYDPASALQIVPRFAPEIAVIDIGLPVMDGYELVHRLRAELASRECLFIALTGYGQDADRQRSRRAGFHHHFVKPLDPSRLLGLIETLSPRAPSVADG